MNKISEKTLIEIKHRSENRCEVLGCMRLDWRGLHAAHIVHRGIGGRSGEAEKQINDARNVAYLCAYHHDVLDGRNYQPWERKEFLPLLKERLNWGEWAKETHEKGIKVRLV